MEGKVQSLYPNAITQYLKSSAKKNNLDFGIVSWRYRYETINYAQGIEPQKIR